MRSSITMDWFIANPLLFYILPASDWFQRFYCRHRSARRKINKARNLVERYDFFAIRIRRNSQTADH